MPNPEFDFSANGHAPGGWRLARLEMVNWGTFDGPRVHVLAPEMGWSLLVGENASGKSTVVDALRTLLVPRRLLRYSFNDAAGGQKKQDRSLVSYIRGAWSTQREEDSADTQLQHLRKEETPSYLLAVFRNARRGTAVTLAQILWVANGKDDAHFLVSNGEKSIVTDLQEKATGRELVKRLRDRGWKVCEGKSYREEFCERMGIPGDGALEIFNQAIGVKEVGDVNRFLREHLLAPGEAAEIIRERVIPQFDNLDDCWSKIETAETQIAMLAPIVEAHARVEIAEASRKELRELIEALPLYYARRHETLLAEHVDACVRELDGIEAALAELKTKNETEQTRRDSLKQQLDGDEVGRRIKELEVEMKELDLRAKERRTNHEQLSALIAAHELAPMPDSEMAFASLRERVAARQTKQEAKRILERERESRAGVEKARADEELERVQRDLDVLKQRRALIPAEFQDIRDALCAATGIEADELPFAGELMEVKPEYATDWAGALERLLHGFGVSLLVPQRHYQRVASWVNGRRLVTARGDGLRFTFHRVSAEPPQRASRVDDPREVVLRMNFRTEHPLVRWIESEVRRAFPHVCCRDTTELERELYGLTAQGLIRGGTRHVKDDRRAVNERRHFVLGWSPEQKVRALKEEREKFTQRHVVAAREENNARLDAKECEDALRALESVSALRGFVDIDFQTEQDQLARLATEKAELEAADDRRKTLKKQFDDSERLLAELATQRDKKIGDKRTREWQRDTGQTRLEAVREEIGRAGAGDLSALHERFLAAEEGIEWRPGAVTHENAPEIREAVRRSLQSRLGHFSEEVNTAQREMIAPMQKFLTTFPDESKDLQPRAEYAPDFVAFHDRVKNEDLPAHKERFRDFLNINLTQSISLLETKLDEEVKAHQARIEQVNATLVTLDYTPATFVELDRRPTRDTVIRTFRGQLRDCLGTGLKRDDEHARLTLYEKIRELVARFQKDAEWTAHVADSRRWLDFGVRETRRADGQQVNYFDSSVGKSGGQKAKLAFTILAASLLAQYGLADDPDRADSLRLVVVDEVFARTDEPNSRRALNLFKRMGFQLLVVVPWEAKARIAEDYVDTFHLTLNPNENASEIQLATRAQYEAARPPAHAQPE